MKKEMKFNRLFVSLMIAGCTLGFVACSDDDDPQTPTEPKVEDVYGDYTGTMQTVLLDQSTFAEARTRPGCFYRGRGVCRCHS